MKAVKPYRTTRIRVYKSMVDDLKLYFPEVRTADLMQVMYNTSALKLEAYLRAKKSNEK